MRQSLFYSPMPDPLKKLIVVGDRVLLTPAEGEERTNVRLYCFEQ